MRMVNETIFFQFAEIRNALKPDGIAYLLDKT
jgi:hypothetical protein